MLLFYIILFLNPSHAENLNPFEDFKFPLAGKIEVRKQLHKLFRRHIYIEKDDLLLNIKKDILPWNQPSLPDSKLKKRRKLRRIVEWVKETYLRGAIGHYDFINIIWPPTDRPMFDRGYHMKQNTEGALEISRVDEGSIAEEFGIKKGWLINAVGGTVMPKNYDSVAEASNKVSELKREAKKRGDYSMTFKAPKFFHITDEDIYKLDLKSFTKILGMDFVQISNNARYKSEL